MPSGYLDFDLVAVVNDSLFHPLRGLIGNYPDAELANHLHTLNIAVSTFSMNLFV